MNHRFTFFVVLLLTLLAPPAANAAASGGSGTSGGRPNLLLILADDLGYSDLGCYGSNIATPNLDKLAAQGLRFTSFYNTARCWPTRTSLMTGLYPHQAHVAMHMGEKAPPAYSGLVPDSVPLLPQLLKPLGYRSYHSGKWHINQGKVNEPFDRGFEHSYFVIHQDNYFFPKFVKEDKTLITDFPPGYYATDAITDYAIKYLDEHHAQHAAEPFFMYLAYTAPHFPLHAPAEEVAKYRGKYKVGWDAIRQQRLARMKELGIYDGELSARDEKAVAWDTLSDAEKDEWDGRMATHAAMIDREDQNIGRVLGALTKQGVLDNTLILFLSDNGASAEWIVRGEGHDPSAPIGSRKTYRTLEVGWANAANTPFRQHKIWVHEGGISTPLIAHWPAGLRTKPGSLTGWVGHVIDIAPTFIELAGGAPEVTKNMSGVSFAPILRGQPEPPHDPLFWEHQGNKAIRKGEWKLVAEWKKPWELYHITTDRCEMHNVAAEHPDIVRELSAAWQKEADAQGVVPWESLKSGNAEGGKAYRMK